MLISAASSRKRSSTSTCPRSPRAPRGTDGGAGPGLRASAVRGRPRTRQARRVAGAARPVRRRPRREPRADDVLLLAVLIERGEAGRPPPRARGGGRELRQLREPADRKPPHAGDLPHPAGLRAPLGGG